MKILILGNSITRHAPKPEIGWVNNYGMSASCIENDYVHLTIEEIHKRFAGAECRFDNIAEWERDFLGFDLNSLNLYKDFAADVIVLRIGENINQDFAKANDFMSHLQRLIAFLSSPDSQIVLTTNFWGAGLDLFCDSAVRKLCREKGYVLVELGQLGLRKSNLSYPTIEYVPLWAEHKDVCEHPGDKGMREIADLVIKGIFETTE